MEDAAKFGIMPGDVINTVDDKKVRSVASFRGALAEKQSGDHINLVIERGDALLTINRRFRGRMEVPSEVGTVYSTEMVRTSNESTSDPQEPPAEIYQETQVIKNEWADFGLRFTEDGGRLIVSNVKPDSACAAYGVEPNDILFQVDDHKITSLSDFHRLAAEKFVGDRANLMLIRGENIVLIEEMQLAATGAVVETPADFQQVVYSFASLDKDALERLLTNPFEANITVETDGDAEYVASVPPAPSDDSIANVTDNELANTGVFDFDAVDPIDSDVTMLPPLDEPYDIAATESADTSYAPTSPELGLGDFDVFEPSNQSTVKRFSDVDEIDSVAEANANFPKPNAIPRFNKYSGIQLPEDIANSDSSDTDSVAEEKPTEASSDKTFIAESTPQVDDTFYDGVRLSDEPTEASNPTATASSKTSSPNADFVNDVPFTTDPTSTRTSDGNNAAPNSPSSVLADTSSEIFDNSTTLEASRISPNEPTYSGSTNIANNLATEPQAGVAPYQPYQSTPQSQSAETYPTYDPASSAGQTNVTANVSSVIPNDSAPVGQYATTDTAPISEYATPDQVTSDYASPQAIAQPQCSACGDWGCSHCTFKAHDAGSFSLNRVLYGNCEQIVSVGGWFSAGYHSESNDLFNSRPDQLGLHQAWLYAEKAATSDSPIGFRADLMYGIDADDTQAFGNTPGQWDFDNGFDFGSYGWAIPQLYLEVALGEWNIKAGHFFTLVGYEVVTAPDNFFYSHAMTMYNSEPFTHTGVLATRSLSDNLEIYAGWTLGWDTGFDQFNDGSSWLGGFSYTISEDVNFTYISTAGNFGARGDDAYSHSMVANLVLTDQLTWVVQSDYLRVEGTGEDNVGLNQYLLYEVNDKVGVGTRLEWWQGDVLTGYAPHGGVLPAAGSLSYYAATFGVNFKPRSNIILRPELRHDWSPAANYDQTYFGMDAIFSF